MDWSLIISVISIIIATIALIKSFVDGREHCTIILVPGLAFYKNDGSFHEMFVADVPGIQIHIINSCRRPIAIDFGTIVVDKWKIESDLIFYQSVNDKKTNVPFDVDKIIIQPGQRIITSITNSLLADEIHSYNNELVDIKVWARIQTESRKVFHSKPLVVSKEKLEEALKIKELLSSSK